MSDAPRGQGAGSPPRAGDPADGKSAARRRSRSRSRRSAAAGSGAPAAPGGRPAKQDAARRGTSQAQKGGAAARRDGSRPPKPGGRSGPVPSGGVGPGGRPGGTAGAAPPSAAPATAGPARSDADRRHARIGANRRRAQLLCAGAAAVPALVLGVVGGLVAGPVVGAVVAACVLVAAAVVLARRAASIALATIGGRPMRDDEDPALANLVDGLCATIGVTRPDLWLVDDPVLNACTLAGRHGRGVLVVTSGLRGALGLIEMEGVVAHELAHVRNHDAFVSSVAVATFGQVGRLVGNDRLVHAAVGRGREYAADRDGVLVVRYPPGLRDALGAMARSPLPAPRSVFGGGRWAATRWVWIDPMVGSSDRVPVGELDATDVRRDALAEW